LRIDLYLQHSTCSHPLLFDLVDFKQPIYFEYRVYHIQNKDSCYKPDSIVAKKIDIHGYYDQQHKQLEYAGCHEIIGKLAELLITGLKENVVKSESGKNE